MKKLLFAGILLSMAAVHGYAIDKDAFATHLRKSLSLDTRTPIQLSSQPIPSGIDGLLVADVLVGGAPYPVYFSKDQKKYFWGFMSDMTQDPDKARAALINTNEGHALGISSAPVTIVEYSDLQCSHCKQAHETIKKELYTNYTSAQVRFVFKHFPLTGHDWAENAAVAAECAGAQKENTFWDMATYFFTNQPSITKDNLKAKAAEAAKAASLDAAAFEKCLADPAMMAKVQAQKKEGMMLGVNSTPAFFVNGRPRRGFRDFEDIKVVIEEKLKEKK